VSDLDLVTELRVCAERNSTLYGSGGCPPNDLLPADKMWFAAMDAAKEIERLRTEVAVLAMQLSAAEIHANELQALIDALAVAETPPWGFFPDDWTAALDALLAEATPKEDGGR